MVVVVVPSARAAASSLPVPLPLCLSYPLHRYVSRYRDELLIDDVVVASQCEELRDLTASPTWVTW